MRKPLDKTQRGWWKQAVFYQIYPKSFQDTDGDGLGDLPGILRHLDYLETLGIDGIWLSPVFASPQADNGYDISDYCAIDPLFGSMEDMETLIREAKKRGISIIMDLVLNHSSDEHFWFREACKSRDNPYHDYYVWRDGDGITPPNDMRATFGGSAWSYVPGVGQYYFHQFAVKQPDLNWENPELRQEIYRLINWWLEKGLSGFRLVSAPTGDAGAVQAGLLPHPGGFGRRRLLCKYSGKSRCAPGGLPLSAAGGLCGDGKKDAGRT